MKKDPIKFDGFMLKFGGLHTSLQQTSLFKSCPIAPSLMACQITM